MARDAVVVTALALNAGVAEIEGVAINTTNGATIAAGGDTSRLVIWVYNSESAEKDVTVVAPTTHAEAVTSGQDDLVVAIAAAGTAFITVESARFSNADGTIYLNYESGMTGFAAAYRLPKSV